MISPLDTKINAVFEGRVVRKDLVKTVKGNAIVPSYVLEYLLGQYCATNDEATIEQGIDTVRSILAKHYVNRNEAKLIQSKISQRGFLKVIDKIEVEFNDKKNVHEAKFFNLGISRVLVSAEIAKKHEKLLVGGVWCISEVSYDFNEEDSTASPWVINSIKPIQMASFDLDGFLAAREQFTLEEWVDLMMQSIGFNPAVFGKRNKLLQLVRLIPFCERNYNLMELGPKGTGKSHIYSEFSPHGMLISGGEITAAKLFVNNSNGKLGLVGYWDCVAFDEFAGKTKKSDRGLVDIMKNYMANKSFSRGIGTTSAEASMVFVGNTSHTVPWMLRHCDLFDDLPEAYHDSAFLDRIHFYLPGWEVDIIRGEMFSNGYGFIVDYLAEVLKKLRVEDFSDKYRTWFTLGKDISTRDRDGINKTFAGLMKILFPSGNCTKEEAEELLRFAMEGRKRVKDQLSRIDSTFTEVPFVYIDEEGTEHEVQTNEELNYPDLYTSPSALSAPSVKDSGEAEPFDLQAPNTPAITQPAESRSTVEEVKPCHIMIREGQRGVSYKSLMGPYLKGAKKIEIIDPYFRLFYQIRNLMELMELLAEMKSPEDEIDVHIVTTEADDFERSQDSFMEQLITGCESLGIRVTWEKATTIIHDRSIVTDTGWKIIPGRGLDIFQTFDAKDAFNPAARLQTLRSCKEFTLTTLRLEE